MGCNVKNVLFKQEEDMVWMRNFSEDLKKQKDFP